MGHSCKQVTLALMKRFGIAHAGSNPCWGQAFRMCLGLQQPSVMGLTTVADNTELYE